MKLLLENWRQYIKEGEAEHFPWLKEIKSIEPRELASVLTVSDNFIPMGSGAFRRVFSPVTDPAYVIKIAAAPDLVSNAAMRVAEGYIMNKDDFETANRYPLIFPRAYAHATDFAWVVMEKMTVTLSAAEMWKVLGKSFPAELDALQDVLTDDTDEWGWPLPWAAEAPAPHLRGRAFNVGDPFSVLDMIMASFRSDRSDDSIIPAGITKELQKILAPIAGAAYQELSKAMHEFEIDKSEIGRGNHGHDKDYNFKIIDSSVFSSDPDEDV